MKRYLVAALVFVVASAFGQTSSGAPADVPKDHWAFSAVDNLYKAGILHGYPDGLFRGSRSVSRYELAVTLGSLQLPVVSLRDRIADLDRRTEALAKKSELDDLLKQVEAIRASLKTIREQHDDVRSLTSTFKAMDDQVKALDSQVKSVVLPTVKGLAGR